jgi:6-phosphogluconolactonase
MKSNMAEICIYPDIKDLAYAAAERVVAASKAAIKRRGRFVLALSGGTTPAEMYRLLATDDFIGRLDWAHVHVFWGDERCVPPEDPDSNYRMARLAFLDQVPLPKANIHRIAGELNPRQAAGLYEQVLRDFFDPKPAAFDLVLLGLGEDGHTASLFPGSAALHENGRWVVENYSEKMLAWRITLPPPIINAAREVVFLVNGKGKANVLRRVLKEARQPQVLPAQLIQPTSGRLFWLIDSEASSEL